MPTALNVSTQKPDTCSAWGIVSSGNYIALTLHAPTVSGGASGTGSLAFEAPIVAATGRTSVAGAGSVVLKAPSVQGLGGGSWHIGYGDISLSESISAKGHVGSVGTGDLFFWSAPSIQAAGWSGVSEGAINLPAPGVFGKDANVAASFGYDYGVLHYNLEIPPTQIVPGGISIQVPAPGISGFSPPQMSVSMPAPSICGSDRPQMCLHLRRPLVRMWGETRQHIRRYGHFHQREGF